MEEGRDDVLISTQQTQYNIFHRNNSFCKKNLCSSLYNSFLSISSTLLFRKNSRSNPGFISSFISSTQERNTLLILLRTVARPSVFLLITNPKRLLVRLLCVNFNKNHGELVDTAFMSFTDAGRRYALCNIRRKAKQLILLCLHLFFFSKLSFLCVISSEIKIHAFACVLPF